VTFDHATPRDLDRPSVSKFSRNWSSSRRSPNNLTVNLEPTRKHAALARAMMAVMNVHELVSLTQS
jgi:hypothetical protein